MEFSSFPNTNPTKPLTRTVGSSPAKKGSSIRKQFRGLSTLSTKILIQQQIRFKGWKEAAEIENDSWRGFNREKR